MSFGMLPVYERLAELHMQKKHHKLTPEELREMEQCLDLNDDYCYRLSQLHNLSFMASLTNDVQWQHEVCQEIERTAGPLSHQEDITGKEEQEKTEDSPSSHPTLDNDNGPLPESD